MSIESEMPPVPVRFGKRVLTESYFDGRLHSLEISSTETIDVESTTEAVKEATKRVADLTFFGQPKRSITVQFDIDEKGDSEHRIKRIHVTHISTKQQIPVINKSKK